MQAQRQKPAVCVCLCFICCPAHTHSNLHWAITADCCLIKTAKEEQWEQACIEWYRLTPLLFDCEMKIKATERFNQQTCTMADVTLSGFPFSALNLPPIIASPFPDVFTFSLLFFLSSFVFGIWWSVYSSTDAAAAVARQNMTIVWCLIRPQQQQQVSKDRCRQFDLQTHTHTFTFHSWLQGWRLINKNKKWKVEEESK